jgi:hypothetical protein
MKLDLRLFCAATLSLPLLACGGIGASPSAERLRQAATEEELREEVERTLLEPRGIGENRVIEDGSGTVGSDPSGEHD